MKNKKPNQTQPFILLRGVVEDNNDPLKIGRVRVRIFGVHSDKNEKSGAKFEFVKTSELPWAEVMGSTGFGIGISLGITIRAGASTGGMDIPPLVLNKWFHLPVSSTMMVFDFIILAAQAAFSPVRQSLYGVVMAIIYTVVLDKVLMLGTTRTEVKIISAKSDEICAAIFAQLDRGVTILHGEGGYLREPESVLLSVVSNRQLPRLEKLAHAIDPTCFMIVSHVTEVSGRGFSLEKDYQAEG